MLDHHLLLGYDPGGDAKHGVAAVRADRSFTVSVVECATVASVECAAQWFLSRMAGAKRVALGVDTLTVWSSGPKGWRPADRRLKAAYPLAKKSILASNSLHGAMSVNGMALITILRGRHPMMVVTETHPKILWYALTSSQYDYARLPGAMNGRLGTWLGAPASAPAIASPQNDHEWDALASAYAGPDESVVMPGGQTSFFWPALPS